MVLSFIVAVAENNAIGRHNTLPWSLPEDMKFFTAATLDPRTLTGKTVRVRGWISLLNGPEIGLTHPEQIEILP